MLDRKKAMLRDLGIMLLNILIAMVIGSIFILLQHENPLRVYYYLIVYPFTTVGGLAKVLAKATPLIFTGLAALVCFRCQLFNVGVEGQIYLGALAGSLVILFVPVPSAVLLLLLACLTAMLVGGLWAMLAGWLKVRFRVHEVISTIMLNYVATLFMGVLYTSWIRDENIPQTPAISKLVQLPRVISNMRFTWGFVLALVVGLVLYYVLFWTSGGFKLRAVGYNMTASRFNGIPVKRYILTSFIISGAIAGLGGGAELLGTQFRLINGFGAGYGFDGVAMALIGQLHPIATVIVALFFAALRVGSTTMQAATGVPTSVSDIIQALVIVFSVAGMALTKLPEFESWKNRLFSKRKRKAGDK